MYDTNPHPLIKPGLLRKWRPTMMTMCYVLHNLYWILPSCRLCLWMIWTCLLERRMVPSHPSSCSDNGVITVTGMIWRTPVRSQSLTCYWSLVWDLLEEDETQLHPDSSAISTSSRSMSLRTPPWFTSSLRSCHGIWAQGKGDITQATNYTNGGGGNYAKSSYLQWLIGITRTGAIKPWVSL